MPRGLVGAAAIWALIAIRSSLLRAQASLAAAMSVNISVRCLTLSRSSWRCPTLGLM